MSKTTTSAADSATIRLRSKALVGGSIEIAANKRRRKRRLASGRRLKELTVPLFMWFLREAPRPLAKLPVTAFLGLVRLLHRVPSNPLRRAVEDMSVICRAKGQDIEAVAIYEGLLDNTHAATELALRLYRDGWESAIDDVHISAADVTRIQNLVDQYGGVAVAVPHNIGSVLSGVRFAKAFSSVLVAKNPTSIERTRIALDFFEHLDAKVLMVRDASAMRIARLLIKLLRSGKAVVLTFDLLAGPKDGIAAKVFGARVWFLAWVTRVPTAAGVPIVPAYVHTVGSQMHVSFGPKILAGSADEATAGIAEFFEQHVVEDPASWAFMADKRWGRVLAEAAARSPFSGKAAAAPGQSSER